MKLEFYEICTSIQNSSSLHRTQIFEDLCAMQANAFAPTNTSDDTVSIVLATAWVTADGQRFLSN
jgi:hypothetical protein